MSAQRFLICSSLIFWGVDSPYILFYSSFNLSTMATFFSPQGGRCREVQMYVGKMKLYTLTEGDTLVNIKSADDLFTLK